MRSGWFGARGDDQLVMASGATDVPGLRIRDRVVTLSAVPHGAIATAEFELQNNGTDTIEIANVVASCGCMSASTSNHTISPGARTLVTVRIDTGTSTESSFHKAVTVQFAGRLAERTIEMYVSGTIDFSNDLTVFPGSINFGSVATGAAVERDLFVRCVPALLKQLPSEIQFDQAERVVPIMDLASPPPSPAADASLGTQRIRCYLKAESPGRVESKICFLVRGPEHRQIEVPVTAIATPPISATPARLLIVSAPGQRSQTSVSFVLRSALSPGVIQEISTTLPLTITRARPDADRELRFFVRAAEPVVRNQEGYITVRAGSGVAIQIPVSILFAPRLGPGSASSERVEHPQGD
jgi:hypothetical protein